VNRDDVIGTAFAVAIVLALGLTAWYGDESQTVEIAGWLIVAALVAGFFLYLKFGRRSK
jgi:hypothetical protein